MCVRVYVCVSECVNGCFATRANESIAFSYIHLKIWIPDSSHHSFLRVIRNVFIGLERLLKCIIIRTSIQKHLRFAH